MATILESGKLLLSPEEVIGYRAAADRLCESCHMTLRLEMPITIEDWLFLRLTDSALKGNLRDLDSVIARVRGEIQYRRKRQ